MSAEIPRLDPAFLAANAARRIPMQEDTFETQTADVKTLGELDQAATDLGIIDLRYWVETGRGLAMPKPEAAETYEEALPVKDFYGLQFEGLFIGYAKLDIGNITHHDSIGRNVGATGVRALCLTFNEATLLPVLSELPEGQFLYVPVPAVDAIDYTDRAMA